MTSDIPIIRKFSTETPSTILKSKTKSKSEHKSVQHEINGSTGSNILYDSSLKDRRHVNYSQTTHNNSSGGTQGNIRKSQVSSTTDVGNISDIFLQKSGSPNEILYDASLDNIGCEDGVVTQIDWSELNEQFDEDSIFDYSDFYFKLDELIDEIRYAHLPTLNIRKLKDFALNKDEQNGILSFRMISTGLSCLDIIPRLHKYVFTRLTLRNLNLTNIITVARHRYLRHINLSHNSLTEVSCLSECPFLIHLDVSYNRITELLNFTPPYYLTTVIYDNNNIKTIPNLSEFWSIVHLKIENNLISKMEGLNQLRFLKTLNLSGNKIKRIEGISNLYIEELNLSNNYISKFEDGDDNTPYGFKTMPCLNYVNLSQNQLKSLKLFENSATLRIINVSKNRIDDLLELGYFQYDIDLISLNMIENPICKLPGYRQLCIQHVINIKYLDEVFVEIKEKVTANCVFSPNLWLCSLNKHAVCNFFKYFNMPVINLSTVPYDHPSTPIITIVGPEVLKNDLAYEFCKTYPKHTYFVKLYTTQPPVYDKDSIYATYHHINRQKFNSMAQAGEFISVYSQLGHVYGFAHSELVKAIESKSVAIVSNDITGAFTLRTNGLNPTLIKATSQYPENYRRWLQSVTDTYFWDILRPKDSAIILARKFLKLTPESDHIVRQSRDIHYDFATNIVELENKEICCECTCDCVKFFKHVEDWEKFINTLHHSWFQIRQNSKNYIPSQEDEEKKTYEKSRVPSISVKNNIMDYLYRTTAKVAKMYDELHCSNPGLFADSIYTDDKFAAFEKLKYYVKKKFNEYKESCREPFSEIPKDDAYLNMINRRINDILEDLNDSENTALQQRKEALAQVQTFESNIPEQLDPVFDDIVQRYAKLPRIYANKLPKIPIHLNATLNHLLFDD